MCPTSSEMCTTSSEIFVYKTSFTQIQYKKKSVNPMLPNLNYETVKIKQEMILYSSSDLCAIRQGPHPLINMENYISY